MTPERLAEIRESWQCQLPIFIELFTHIDEQAAEIAELKGHLDAVAEALHPNKPKGGRWAYLPQQLAEMVVRQRDILSERIKRLEAALRESAIWLRDTARLAKHANSSIKVDRPLQLANEIDAALSEAKQEVSE